MSTMTAPRCTFTKTDSSQERPCGLPMFRVGTEENSAWVCQICDGGVGDFPPNYSPDQALES